MQSVKWVLSAEHQKTETSRLIYDVYLQFTQKPQSIREFPIHYAGELLSLNSIS